MVSALRSMQSFKKGSQCKALGPRCTGLSVTLALQNLADLGDLGVSENRGTPLNHPFLVGSVQYIRPFWETFHFIYGNLQFGMGCQMMVCHHLRSHCKALATSGACWFCHCLKGVLGVNSSLLLLLHVGSCWYCIIVTITITTYHYYVHSVLPRYYRHY